MFQTDTRQITLVGSQSSLNNDKIGVGLVVDLASYKSEDLSEGRDYYDITANIENSTGCWVYGSYKAQVELVKK